MADEPTELEIKIIPDEEANLEVAKAADEKVAAKEEPKEEKVEKKDPAVEELTSQYKELEAREASERSRRIAAETEAARHRSEAETARKQVASSQLDTVVTALNAAKESAEQAKRDLRAARESGNVDDEVEAADRLAIARAEERRLDEAKDDLEARAKAQPRRQDTQPTDVVEAFVRGRTQPTADWIRAHPEFVRTETGLKKLTAADAVAQAEGLVPDTPEYFARAEEYLGITKKEAPKTATEAAQVKPRASAPVAPGSAVANGGSGGGQEVRLTQREANAAQDGTIVWNTPDPTGKNRWKVGDPIGLVEMGRRKLAMQKSGLYDKSQYEA